MTVRVGLRCDAAPRTGAGHVIRCLALADELRHRGAEVDLLGTVADLPWVTREVELRGIAVHPAPADPHELTAQATGLGLDAVVLDGYTLDPGTGAALRAAGVRVLSLADGTFGAGQEADVYLDQNLHATPVPGAREGAVQLLGLDHVLFRDTVVAAQRAGADAATGSGRGPETPPRVLCVFGGTDAHRAAPTMVPLLLSTDVPVHVVVVAADVGIRTELEALVPAPGQRVEVLDPVSDLAALTVTCDLAVSAAGSSVWELMCLGVPAALVCVADNQEASYADVVGLGAVAPLGLLSALREDGPARERARDQLLPLLTDPALRAELGGRGRALVDGRGRSRVVDVLLAPWAPTSVA